MSNPPSAVAVMYAHRRSICLQKIKYPLLGFLGTFALMFFSIIFDPRAEFAASGLGFSVRVTYGADDFWLLVVFIGLFCIAATCMVLVMHNIGKYMACPRCNFQLMKRPTDQSLLQRHGLPLNLHWTACRSCKVSFVD